MSGRRSRSKGKRGELEACEALKDVWPGLQRIFGQARAQSGAADIDGRGCPVHIEVKRQESINVHAAMAQAYESARLETGRLLGAAMMDYEPMRPPLVIHKRNRGEWLVTVRASDLARLVSGARR